MNRAAAAMKALLPSRPPSLVLAALAILALHGFYAWATGVRMASDSAAYAYWSARLVETGFDYPRLLAEASPQFPALLYVLFASLLALLRLGFGEGWTAALVALNLAAHVGLGLLVVRLAVRTTGSAAAGWAALLLFLGCHGIVKWVPFLLSDASFVFLAFAIFTLAAARILGDARGWLAVAPAAAAGIFYRPTGIVLVPDLVLSWWLSRRRVPFLSRTRAALLLAAATLGGALLFAWLVQDPSRWPFVTLSTAFEVVAQGYAGGEVVNGRAETYHAPPAGLADYLLISADRFVHFFAIGARDHSLLHWTGSAAFFVPAYALAGWLGFVLWRGDSALPPAERRVFVAAGGAVLAYAVFHALVQVDYDWRYRLPILPHLILLASGGAADLARRAGRR